MSMFCYQCQETAKNQGCAKAGVCGKKAPTANLQDLLIFVLKGISSSRSALLAAGGIDDKAGEYVPRALFTTVTNVSFDDKSISSVIAEGLALKDDLNKKLAAAGGDLAALPECSTWSGTEGDFEAKAPSVGVLSTENEDVRSLRELLIYGVKGIAAYYHHATVLGHRDPAIEAFTMEALQSTTQELSVDEMIAMVLKAGEFAVSTMALLDKANTTAYGNPELTEVDLGVRNNPGILISGHDLKDLEQLLTQTAGTGIDVYTHGEMLPAHYYPAFKKYDNFVGNYGGAWYEQKEQFEAFNGPVLMTTNCLVPPRDSYKGRLFTTGVVGFPGVTHIEEDSSGKKDFSGLIEMARNCSAPTELETGKIVGGFAHAQVMALADKVVDAVKAGAVKKFVVMAGCDGRQKEREYFTDIAEELPSDTIILTAGCAKFRYNKLDLGDIGGIPRVLDAGQCNDSYSLAVIALKLKEVFALEDINDLPLEFDVAWYEQKAVTVLLALLHLGFKGVRIGPTLPAFLSPTVAKTLVEAFDLKATGEVKEDLAAITA